MSEVPFLLELHDAYLTRNVKALREILFIKSEFIQHPKSRSEVEWLVLKAANSFQSNGIIESLINFLEIGVNGNLEKYLKIAILRGNLQWAEFLLKNGAELKGSEWEEKSPTDFVFCSCDFDNRKEMFVLLLKYGLDPHYRNRVGNSILHQLISFTENIVSDDAIKIAEILINNGISIEEVDANGYSPLMKAVGIGDVEFTLFFIKKGANLNVQNYRKNSALHIACQNHYEEVIRLLVRKGANINAENANGLTSFLSLSEEDEDYDLCMAVMVREFSKLIFQDTAISEKDKNYLQTIPIVREYFEQCTAELEIMKKTKFYGSYTYYSVLMTKNIKKLTNLTRNEAFITKFEENLSSFSCYEVDLRIILEEAIQLREESEAVLMRSNEIFDKIFPEVVIRNLAKNLTLEDLPLK